MSPKNILLIQLRRIGDVVFTLPVIEVLKKNLPSAKIDFLTEEPSDQLVRLNPSIHETLVYRPENALAWIAKIRKRKYDCILDFHANGRSLILALLSGSPLKIGFSGPVTRALVYDYAIHTDRNKFIVEQKLDLLRPLQINDLNWDWDLKIPETEQNLASQFLRQNQIKPSEPLLGFAPIHRHAIRAWNKEHFIETANAANRRYHSTALLIGGPGEEKELHAIAKNMGGKTIVAAAPNLLQLGALIEKCNLLIANDNGPQKIAMALKVPSITIFGPTNPHSINPNKFPHFALRDKQLFCIGCELKNCPTQHECMQNVTPEMMMKTVELLMSKKKERYEPK